jgi:hypothetical protein
MIARASGDEAPRSPRTKRWPVRPQTIQRSSKTLCVRTRDVRGFRMTFSLFDRESQAAVWEP